MGLVFLISPLPIVLAHRMWSQMLSPTEELNPSPDTIPSHSVIVATANLTPLTICLFLILSILRCCSGLMGPDFSCRPGYDLNWWLSMEPEHLLLPEPRTPVRKCLIGLRRVYSAHYPCPAALCLTSLCILSPVYLHLKVTSLTSCLVPYLLTWCFPPA